MASCTQSKPPLLRQQLILQVAVRQVDNINVPNACCSEATYILSSETLSQAALETCGMHHLENVEIKD